MYYLVLNRKFVIDYRKRRLLLHPTAVLLYLIYSLLGFQLQPTWLPTTTYLGSNCCPLGPTLQPLQKGREKKSVITITSCMRQGAL